MSGPKPERDPVAEYLALKKGTAPDPVSDYLTARSGGFDNPGVGRSFGDSSEPHAGMVQTVIDAVPFGTKGEALIDTGVNRLLGNGPKGYDQNLLNRKAGVNAFRDQHPRQALAATIAGAALPVLATMGGAAPEEGALLAPKATLLSRLVTGSAEGAAYGGLQGASEAHGSLQDYQDKIQQGLLFGGAAGAAGTALGAGASALARKVGVPKLLSNTAAGLADRTQPGGTANRFLTKLASMLGPQGEAASLVGQRQAADRMVGFTPNDFPNQVPMMALDRAGPATEQLAQGIAHGPAGPGQASIVKNMGRRMAHMRPSVQDAIQEGTGVAPQQGMEPLRQLIKAQSDEADELYTTARQATKGQPVKSETLDAVRQTPIGQQAYAWAVAQKANRLSPLPQVSTVNTENALLKNLRGMGVPDDKAMAALGDQAMQTETLPDPETIHLMKQYVANVAHMGIRDGAEGKLATQAQGVLGVWGLIRKELPPEWRTADDAFARKAQLINAMNEGRNVFRTQVNPAGRPRKAVQNSLDAFEQRTSAASPEAQHATATGVGMAAQERAAKLGTSVKSPGRLFGGDANEQRMAIGIRDPEKAQAFQRLVSAWDQIQGQNQRILGNSATGGRVAEQALRAPDQATTSFFRELVHGNFGRALSTVGGQASGAAERAHRGEVDKAIADILTNQNPHALDEARLTALLRLRLTGTAGNLLPRLAGSEANADHTPQ